MLKTVRALQHDLLLGKLTCTAVVQQYLRNIQHKAHLNAFLSVYETEALERAALIDKKLQQGTAGKLAGLVVSIKDVLSHRHHPLQAGSNMLQNFTAHYTATAVERLVKEDAIIIGRTNCDEFGMGSSNENSAFGPVLNDADNTRVSGGSSGGAAVAVQADLCHIALGSDTGGSVRQPAAFCGVIGLKPTYSRVSRHGLVAYASSFDCIGIFGKHVEDVALVLEVIAGADEFDSTVSHRAVPAYASLLADAPKKFRFACYRETITATGLQPAIKKTLQQTIDTLRAEGHVVEEIDFPLLKYCLPAYYMIVTAEASTNLSRYDGVRYGYRSEQATDLKSLYTNSRSEGFGKEVQRRIMLGTFVLSAGYFDAYFTKAQKVRRLIREKTQKILSDYDFILAPITPTTAFPLGKKTSNPVETYLADLFSVQANVAGVPAISLPCGTDDQGLPVGLQIMANDFEEPKLFQFAAQFLNERKHE